MYKINFYAPSSHVDLIKQAMFAAGAGKIGEYTHCSWQTEGVGQFMPLDNSQPYIGKKNQIEKVSEYKVEMVCGEAYIDDVMQAFKKAHPYEQPAYHVIRLETY